MKRTYLMGQMAHVITTGAGVVAVADTNQRLLEAAAEVRAEATPPPAPAPRRDNWFGAWMPPPPCGERCYDHGTAPCGGNLGW